MNAPINNGGPAFPRPDFHSDTHYTSPAQEGMSLRDYFAAKALAGFAANPDQQCCTATPEQMAGWCYKWSDAMLKAREEVK